jgi:PncC family amidohydrolase
MSLQGLHEKLLALGKKVVVAESCTGGVLSSMLTKFPGSSAYFLAGLVLYSDEAKRDFLGVQIPRDGAACEEVVIDLVEGLFKKTHADIALAVSGIAGPGGATKTKPIGTIYYAIGIRNDETMSGLIPLPQDLSRTEYMEKGARWILETLSERL